MKTAREQFERWDEISETKRLGVVLVLVFGWEHTGDFEWFDPDDIEWSEPPGTIDGNVMIEVLVRMEERGFDVDLEDGVYFFVERGSLGEGETFYWHTWREMPAAVARAACSAILKLEDEKAHASPAQRRRIALRNV